MTNETVFEYLHRKNRAKKELIKNPNTKDCNILNIALPEYLFPDKEPTDDLGRRIEEEFIVREGNLSRSETSLAMEYFSEDYGKSQNKAVKYLEIAQGNVSGSSDWNKYVRKAGKLTSRAKYDVEMAMKISPDRTLGCIPYDVLFKALGNFRDMLQITWEFPENFNEIIPLHFELKKAVEKEDYESASQLRDRIRNLN